MAERQYLGQGTNTSWEKFWYVLVGLAVPASGGLVGPVDLGDRDAFMVQIAGEGGSVGAGALHPGPL
jgi:hypothetical protein